MDGRVLAIDYGERRIGLAISDPMRIIASGLPTLTVHRDSEAIERIREIARQQDVTEIIIGLPVGLDGTENEKTVRIRTFADQVRETTGIHVAMVDERFTTASAKRLLPQIEHKKRRRGKEKLDQIAAVILLQDYLRQAHR